MSKYDSSYTAVIVCVIFVTALNYWLFDVSLKIHARNAVFTIMGWYLLDWYEMFKTKRRIKRETEEMIKREMPKWFKNFMEWKSKSL